MRGRDFLRMGALPPDPRERGLTSPPLDSPAPARRWTRTRVEMLCRLVSLMPRHWLVLWGRYGTLLVSGDLAFYSPPRKQTHKSAQRQGVVRRAKMVRATGWNLFLLSTLPLMQEASRICQKAARTPTCKANASRQPPHCTPHPECQGRLRKNFSTDNRGKIIFGYP